MNKEIVHIVGTRPNFMKLAPVFTGISKYKDINQKIIHTGQHYDYNMSEIFFSQLNIGKIDINFNVTNGSYSEQTAQILLHLQNYLKSNKIDLMIVYGDVNSTLAASIFAVQNHIPIAHVEAGLRSRDLSMPEEINRIIVDSISQMLFTPSEDANENLKNEGKSEKNIFFVGNTMIDTLIKLLPFIQKPAIKIPEKYCLVTLHRQSNVDNDTKLKGIINELNELSNEIDVIFPIHPRTSKKIKELNLKLDDNVITPEPVGYKEFVWLEKESVAVITDSGGIQEETTFLHVPCLTLRENTERPITISIGTNTLINGNLRSHVNAILTHNYKKGEIPPLWDGMAGERIAKIIHESL